MYCHAHYYSFGVCVQAIIQNESNEKRDVDVANHGGIYGRQKNFFHVGWGSSGFFQVVTNGIFPGVPIVVKFHFTNSKRKEKYFSAKTLIAN